MGVTTVSTKPTVQVNDIDTASATYSPTIRQIMSYNNQLPKGVYTDSNGWQFNINTFQRRQLYFNNVDVNSNATLCFIDRGSNNSLEGSVMKLFSTPVTPEYVYGIGS